MIAFADEDLIAVPGQGLTFGAVAPAHDRATGGGGSEREILEAQNLFDDGS